MGDERERMSQDIEGLRKRLLVVNERWEVVCADLKAENARLRDALKALASQAAVVYEVYDNEESGAAAWQEFVALDLARAVAVRLLLPEGP